MSYLNNSSTHYYTQRDKLERKYTLNMMNISFLFQNSKPVTPISDSLSQAIGVFLNLSGLTETTEFVR